MADLIEYALAGILRVLIGLVVAIAVGMTVWWDARRQGDKGASGWALGVVLLMIIVLPLYLIFRFTGRIGMECPSCHKKTSNQFATCRRCGSMLPSPAQDKTLSSQAPARNIKAAAEPLQLGAESLPSGTSTKFCRECGAKIPRDSRFCEECGASLA